MNENNSRDAGDTESITAKAILIVVEDDKDIGTFLVEAISQETNYHALLVVDGFEALKVVHDLKPNLFVLDYHLPKMNGIELYDKLQKVEGLDAVPTIMISAQLPEREIERRSIVGLKKPFDLAELLDTIENLLQ